MMPYFALDNREISYWFPFVKPVPWYKSIWRVSVYGPFIYFFRWMFEEYKELTLYIVYMHKCFHWMSLIHNPSGSMLTKLNNIIVDNSEEVVFFSSKFVKTSFIGILESIVLCKQFNWSFRTFFLWFHVIDINYHKNTRRPFICNTIFKTLKSVYYQHFR